MLPAFTAATGSLTDVHAVSGVTLSASSGAVPPPGGGWSYNGSAALHGSDTILNHAATHQRGTVIYPRAVSTANLSVDLQRPDRRRDRRQRHGVRPAEPGHEHQCRR